MTRLCFLILSFSPSPTPPVFPGFTSVFPAENWAQTKMVLAGLSWLVTLQGRDGILSTSVFEFQGKNLA